MLLPEEPRSERSILVRASRELCESWELALLAVLEPLSQLMWDHHRAPMQIYLHALIFPSYPLVSAQTFPWHLAFTSREL